jgi:hypothetical protein
MKWFDRWLYKKVLDMWNNRHKYEEDSPEKALNLTRGLAINGSNDSITMDNSLKFNVLPAQGGTVIEVRNYDMKTDRNNTSTYVIPESDDLTTSIAHIVSMELLRKG